MNIRDEQLSQFLATHKGVDIPNLVKQDLTYLSATSDAQKSFQTLIDRHITSAPVYDEEKKQFLGTLDIKDFVSFQLASLKQGSDRKTSTASLVTVSRHDVVVPMDISSTLSEVLKHFVQEHLHRSPIMQGDGGEVDASRVLSQSTLISYMALKAEELGGCDTLQASIGDLGITGNVVKFDETESLFDIFSRMVETNINGCAIVDADKGWRLQANLSLSDFRYCMADQGPLLSQSFEEFAKKHPNVGRPIITVSEGETLLAVICKFAELKLHRLYVVPEGQQGTNSIPIGVITLSDVLRICAHTAGLLDEDVAGRTLAVLCDHSVEAKRALHKALAIKKKQDTLLVVVGIELIKPIFAPGAVISFKKENKQLEDAGQESVVALLRGLPEAKKLHVEGVLLVTQGSLKDRVIDFLHERHVDLVVVGTRDLGAVKRVLLGSFSTHVLNHAPCNVLVVRKGPVHQPASQDAAKQTQADPDTSAGATPAAE